MNSPHVYGTGLQVWDTQNWTLVSSNDFGPINWWITPTLSVSRDSALISCGRGLPYATAAELRLFRLPFLEPAPWSERLPKDVAAAAFHPERDLLVTGGWSGDIRLWDSTSGQELPSIMKQSARIVAMAFSPADSNLLATTGGDRSVRLWNLPSQRERARLHGASEGITELAFSMDGRTIATGGRENPITLWDAAQTKAAIIAFDTNPRNCVLGYLEKGESLVTVDATGWVTFRDPRSLAVLETLCRVDIKSALAAPPTVDFVVLALATSPGMKMLALGMTNGAVELWNLVSRTNVFLRAHSAPVLGLAFSPDSRQLVTADQSQLRFGHNRVNTQEMITIELPQQESQTAANMQRWSELLQDRELARIDSRIETDRFGRIIMSPPPAPEHGSYQSQIAGLLSRLMPGGRSLTECPISTADGVKAADVAWVSDEVWAKRGPCFPVAPEICVEVLSPSNSTEEMREKMALYFDAGAKEVWLCTNNGQMQFFTSTGNRSQPQLCPQFPARLTA